MTCIVGLVENNNVWLGGDSAGVSGYALTQRSDTKVFKKDDFIFGFTSSFRMGQLIRYKLKIPEITKKQTVEDYLHTTFIDAIIECFTSNKYATIHNNGVSGGIFLFGFKDKLYFVDNDFHIGESIHNFDAVGCGKDLALGCLHGIVATQMSPELQIEKALSAAETFSAGVRKPFTIISLKNK